MAPFCLEQFQLRAGAQNSRGSTPPPRPGQDWAPHQEGRTIMDCRPSCTWTWLRTWAPAQISRQWGGKSLHLLEPPSLLSSGSNENSFHLLWLLGVPREGTINAQCANKGKECACRSSFSVLWPEHTPRNSRQTNLQNVSRPSPASGATPQPVSLHLPRVSLGRPGPPPLFRSVITPQR